MSELSTQTTADLWAQANDEDLNNRADVLYELATRCDGHSQPGEAYNLFSAAYDIWRKLDNKMGIGRGAYSLGVLATNAGEFFDAVDYLSEAISCYQLEFRTRWEADAWRQLGIAKKGLGDSFEAMSAFEKAIDLFVELGEQRLAAVVMCELAEYRQSLNLHKQALDVAEIAKDYAKDIENPYVVLRATGSIVRCLIALGRRDEALVLQRESLVTAQYLQEDEFILTERSILADVLVESEVWEEAESLLRQTRDAWKLSGELDRAFYADLSRVKVLDALGKTQDVQELLSGLESYANTMESSSKQAEIALVKGTVLQDAGHTSDARAQFDLALSKGSNIFEVPLAIRARVALAESLLSEGMWQSALEVLEPVNPDSYGENVVELARFKSVHAAAQLECGDLRAAEIELLELSALGSGIGLAFSQARGYQLFARLRGIEGREEDMHALVAKAATKYEQAGKQPLADSLREAIKTSAPDHSAKDSSEPGDHLTQSHPQSTLDESVRYFFDENGQFIKEFIHSQDETSES